MISITAYKLQYYIDFSILPVIVILIIIIVMYVIGFLLPNSQSYSKSFSIQAPQELVWSVINDFEHRAEWYEGVIKTEKIRHHPEIWRLDNDRYGSHILIEVNEKKEPDFIKIKLLSTNTFIETKNGNLQHLKEVDFIGEEMISLTSNGKTTEILITLITSGHPPLLRLIAFLGCFKKISVQLYYEKIAKRVDKLYNV